MDGKRARLGDFTTVSLSLSKTTVILADSLAREVGLSRSEVINRMLLHAFIYDPARKIHSPGILDAIFPKVEVNIRVTEGAGRESA